MPFPAHIAAILDEYGVPADTKAALYDLYVSMGPDVLEVFGDIADTVATPAHLTPEDTLSIRARVVRRYLEKNHPRWLEGAPTPSLWHPRALEGRASGLAMPLGELPDIAQTVVDHVPDGMLILGRNAHYGGRQETISFDVVARELPDALALGLAAGQQHTLPGSAGESSGTLDAMHNVALLWEIQPNVYKPAGERNREVAKLYRRHRNWHLVTLACALHWLAQQQCATFILRGEALAPTHDVNPEKPVSDTIVALHNRTVDVVTRAMGLTVAEVTSDDEFLLLESSVMNHALRKHVLQHGGASFIWRVS